MTRYEKGERNPKDDRTLETIYHEHHTIIETSGWTKIFIYPGFQFQAIDVLITNFHLPKSTLVMLVSALASKDNILNAYRVAVEEKYRFFSFFSIIIPP